MRTTRIISAAFLTLLAGVAAIAGAQDKGERGGEKESRPAQQQSRPEARPAEQHAQPQPHAQPQQRQEQARTQERAQQQRTQPQQHAQQQVRQGQNKTQEHAQQQARQDQNKTQRRAQQQRQVQSNQQHAQQRQVQNNQQRAQRSNSQTRGNMQARGTPEQHRVQQATWQQHGSSNWASDHRNWQQRGGYNGYRIPDARFRGYFGPDHGFRIGGLPFLVVGGYPRFQYDGYWLSAVDPWPDYWGANWYDDDDVYVAYVDNGYYMYNRRYPGSGVAISISF
jgi:hypothetical protein